MKDASREHIVAEVLELGALTVSDGSLIPPSYATLQIFSIY